MDCYTTSACTAGAYLLNAFYGLLIWTKMNRTDNVLNE